MKGKGEVLTCGLSEYEWESEWEGERGGGTAAAGQLRNRGISLKLDISSIHQYIHPSIHPHPFPFPWLRPAHPLDSSGLMSQHSFIYYTPTPWMNGWMNEYNAYNMDEMCRSISHPSQQHLVSSLLNTSSFFSFLFVSPFFSFFILVFPPCVFFGGFGHR